MFVSYRTIVKFHSRPKHTSRKKTKAKKTTPHINAVTLHPSNLASSSLHHGVINVLKSRHAFDTIKFVTTLSHTYASVATAALNFRTPGSARCAR
jgi:hypothetical protein